MSLLASKEVVCTTCAARFMYTGVREGALCSPTIGLGELSLLVIFPHGHCLCHSYGHAYSTLSLRAGLGSLRVLVIILLHAGHKAAGDLGTQDLGMAKWRRLPSRFGARIAWHKCPDPNTCR